MLFCWKVDKMAVRKYFEIQRHTKVIFVRWLDYIMEIKA